MTTTDNHHTPLPAVAASVAPSPPVPAAQASPSPDSTAAESLSASSNHQLEHSSRQHHPSSLPDTSKLPIRARFSPEESAAHALQDLCTPTEHPKPKPRLSPPFNNTPINGFSRGQAHGLPSIKTSVNDGSSYATPPSIHASPPPTARLLNSAGMYVQAPYTSGVLGPDDTGTYAQPTVPKQRTPVSSNGHTVSAHRTHTSPSPRTPRFGPYPSPHADSHFRSALQAQHHRAPFLPPPNMLSPAQSSYSTQSVHNLNGFRIWRNAIPLGIAQRAADTMDQGLPVRSKNDSHLTYETSIAAYEVRDEFRKVVRAALEPYYLPYNKQIPSMPSTLVSGQFLATPHDDARLELLHNGAKDKIYVTIALSTCIRATGMYSVLKRSHHDKNPRSTPVGDWEREDVALNPGDALIWRGDLSYLVNPGGGGKWATMLFPWGRAPPISPQSAQHARPHEPIDLTDDDGPSSARHRTN